MSKKKNNIKSRRRNVRRIRKNKLEQKEVLRKKILTFDAPELYIKSSELKRGDDLSFIDDMKNVLMSTDNGVGLAACQIGVNKSVCVLRYNTFNVVALINPVIISKSSSEIAGEEGCLSFPGFVSNVKRPQKVKIKYLNEDFTELTRDFKDFESRIVCHEIEHMFGVCKVGEEYKKRQP